MLALGRLGSNCETLTQATQAGNGQPLDQPLCRTRVSVCQVQTFLLTVYLLIISIKPDSKNRLDQLCRARVSAFVVIPVGFGRRLKKERFQYQT